MTATVMEIVDATHQESEMASHNRNDSSEEATEKMDLNNIPLPPYLQDIINNQAVSDPVYYTLVTLYAVVILGSVIGNLLVITAVLRSPNMRKVNNILIVNLAVSDLLLCTVVSPVTLVELMYKRWMGPKLQWPCQLSSMVPTCITFVSTLTITGIAMDRYKVIVYSATNRSPAKLSSALISLVIVWGLAILMSFPLLLAMNLNVIELPPPVAAIIGEESITYCAEEWGKFKRGRLFYSIFALLVQFILPITLISWAHHAIKKKLQKLPSWNKSHVVGSQQPQPRSACSGTAAMVADTAVTTAAVATSAAKDVKSEKSDDESKSPQHQQRSVTFEVVQHSDKCAKTIHARDVDEEEDEDVEAGRLLSQEPSAAKSTQPRVTVNATVASENAVVQLQNSRLQEKIKKQARTHALLVSIVVVFALSWFPLAVLNIILDIHNIFASDQASLICYALCHLIGMSSAFSNPILYGWFNESFREEFQNIASAIFFCSPSKRRMSTGSPSNAPTNAGTLQGDMVRCRRAKSDVGLMRRHNNGDSLLLCPTNNDTTCQATIRKEQSNSTIHSSQRLLTSKDNKYATAALHTTKL